MGLVGIEDGCSGMREERGLHRQGIVKKARFLLTNMAMLQQQ